MLRGKMPLIIAVALGSVAGLVSYSAVKRQAREARAGWNLVPVMVAAGEITEGSLLSWDNLAQRPVPEQFVTPSVVKPENASYIVGQKLLVPLQSGDLLTWSQLDAARTAERVSSTIVRKQRAVTVAVSDIQGVGGWIRPNDRVDVIGTFRDPEKSEPVALTLLQNVVVIATGKITGTTNEHLLSDAQREYRNVSLSLMQEEAEILTLARELGGLTLTLRHPDDIEPLPQHGHVDARTLLTGARQMTLFEARRRQEPVIIRGNVEERRDPARR